jgi:hypothetical protein
MLNPYRNGCGSKEKEREQNPECAPVCVGGAISALQVPAGAGTVHEGRWARSTCRR